MTDDILEELEEEILYASRKAWDSAQSGLSANFLGRVQGEIERLRAENEKLRAALKPFADAADDLDEDDKDDWEIWEHWAAMNVKIKHLRAARAAYLGEKDD